jgi:predicted chitinase
MAKPKRKYRLGWRALRRLAPNLSISESQELARDLAYAMVKHNITTRRRALMFLAQCAHESGGFHWREELASGEAYEGRVDLGNVHTGDGRRFKGRSFIQVTGRANYRALPHWDGIDFERSPHRLSEKRYACLAAAWWWKNHGCNQLADSRAPGAFIRVTRRINGGTNGLVDRLRYYARARRKANRDMLTPKRRPRP